MCIFRCSWFYYNSRQHVWMAVLSRTPFILNFHKDLTANHVLQMHHKGWRGQSSADFMSAKTLINAFQKCYSSLMQHIVITLHKYFHVKMQYKRTLNHLKLFKLFVSKRFITHMNRFCEVLTNLVDWITSGSEDNTVPTLNDLLR